MVTENPRVGSSILSLGTRISGTYELFVGAFFRLKGSRNGHNSYWVSIQPNDITLKFNEDREILTPRAHEYGSV